MDRLWTLKTDVDPFKAFGFSTIGLLLRIIRCSVYRCPYCRWIFKATWGPTNSLLGTGKESVGIAGRHFGTARMSGQR
jgi:hypothetical protein